MSEAARTRRDDARYEPRLAIPGRDLPDHGAGAADPLAELARLVGQDDPFRNVFRPKLAPEAAMPIAAESHAPAVADAHHAAEPDLYGDHAHVEASHHGEGAEERYDDQDVDHHGQAHAGFDPSAAHETDRSHDPYGSHQDHHGAAGQTAYAEEGVDADGRPSDDHAAAMLPDHWARGEHAYGEGVPEIDRGEAPSTVSGAKSSARRPVMVLATVLVLTGGGLAATFLAKGNPSSGAGVVAASRVAPTIMAATGPTKVKVEDASAVAPEDQDAALLNKNGNVSSGPVKIVSSQEQPADLAQLPKSDLADGARPLPPASPSPFPEPKKVKTFLVHPDGTMLTPDGVASASQGAALTLDGGAALPSTPKTASRGGTTPKVPATAAPATIASLSADTTSADPAAAAASPSSKPGRQPASPGVHSPSPKPVDAAAASPGTGGSYGVQLASSPIEAEANAAFAKLKKKYPTQLGAYAATVHKAETGDKPVYRVRVGGMSQDEAKTLCAQLQGAGGSCFVMHN